MNLDQEIEQWLEANKLAFGGTDRPFVTLCYAQSWDGSITTRSGSTLALSGEDSTRLTHHLRCLHDGILVGISTVLTDDPQLTARLWTGPNPQPIVLDSQLRIPAAARLCQPGDNRCWVLTCQQSTQDPGEGLEIITLPADERGRVDLVAALRLLRDRGIQSLMVEGGANVISAFVQARLADALVVTMAPTIVGGYKAINDLGYTEKCQLPRIHPYYSQRLQDDMIMWGNLDYEANR